MANQEEPHSVTAAVELARAGPLAEALFTPGVVSEERMEATFRTEPIWLARTAKLAAELGRAPIAPVTVVARRVVQAAIPSGEVWRPEIERLLLAPHADVALQWLHDAGLLSHLLPELEVTVDFTQEVGRKHKDVWAHTKQVVRQSAPRLAVRWAALLHDIGKVSTRTFTPDGKVQFHRHAEVGARMFDAVARRFKLDRPLHQRVRFLILHHLRANQYSSGWTDAAVRRFDREMHEYLEDLLDLSRSDVTSKREERRREAWRNIDELAGRVAALREADAALPPLPSGLGGELMRHYGRGPGRWVGELKEALEAAVDSGQLEPRREASYYIAWLDANPK